MTSASRWPVALFEDADCGIPQSQAIREADVCGIDMSKMVEDRQVGARTDLLGQLDAFAERDDRIVAAMNQKNRLGDYPEIPAFEIETPQLVPDRRRQSPDQHRHPRG